ncbi:hypothetical protein C6501_13215 [Candidatus Poribacteria bacterium]|nr:MAG: hypothetical protein C6501_13215 [Candidatus Poribacteria bacterium]
MTSLFLRKNNAIIPLIWLFIYFAIIPMQLSNYVLCIGEDGHVEFEFAVNGCCADAPSHDLDHPEIPAAPDDHCGECIDLPIFASLNSELYVVSVQEYLLSTHSPVSSTSSISHEVPDTFIPTTTPFSIIPPLIDPTLISLRTVTLLI